MKQIHIISTKELRDNLSEILEQVAIGGKEFIVKKFGKVKVKISPIKKEQNILPVRKSIGKLPGFSMWKDRKDMKDPAQFVRDLRKHPAFGMWKDRKDIKNSAKWVADMRRRESLRIRDEK